MRLRNAPTTKRISNGIASLNRKLVGSRNKLAANINRIGIVYITMKLPPSIIALTKKTIPPRAIDGLLTIVFSIELIRLVPIVSVDAHT
jgi:hypothetical protein